LRRTGRPHALPLGSATRALVVLSVALNLVPAPANAAQPAARETVAQALKRLDSPSLHFIYSSQLVPPSLEVISPAAMATSGDALAQARALLAPHGLTLVPVNASLYAVTAAPRSQRAPASPTTGPRETPAAPVASPAEAQDASAARPLTEAVVTGERNAFGLKTADDALLYSATRLGAQPALGEDALISLTRMPGITQGDLSGRVNIRGGGPEETLILLDGFPLRQPWHMPGYRGVLSLIDPGLVRQIAVYQGAIPARYGDRMSGVLDLQSLAPLQGPRHSIGAGFLNGRVRTDLELPGSAGTPNDLLLAARVGSTGYLLKALQPAVGNPHYGDAYARARIAGGDDSELVFNALVSRDTLTINRDGLDERSSMRSSSGYFWLQGTRGMALPGDDAARLALWLGRTHFESARAGQLASPGFSTGVLNENRGADVWDLKTKLDWAWAPSHQLEAGIDVAFGKASYDYASRVSHSPVLAAVLGVPADNTQAVAVDAERLSGAVHASDTWVLAPTLTAQLGLRLLAADRPDAQAISRWDPRAALAWQATPSMTLRTGWGRVHQIRDLTEIVPARNGTVELLPQRTEYWLLGGDRTIGDDTLVRLEGFHKSQLFLTQQQRNLLRSPSILPELSLDRIWLGARSASIRGVEFTLQQQHDDWRWSAAWAYSARREVYAGSLMPAWDRRQSGSLSLEVNSGPWLLSGALNYRDGLPTVMFATNPDGGLVFDQRQAWRLPDSLTMDLRAKYRVPVGDGWLTVIAQVSNLFNNSSCCSEFAPLAGSPPDAPQLTLRRQGSLPAIPYFGLSWDF
jgi:hypothetical protein